MNEKWLKDHILKKELAEAIPQRDLVKKIQNELNRLYISHHDDTTKLRDLFEKYQPKKKPGKKDIENKVEITDWTSTFRSPVDVYEITIRMFDIPDDVKFLDSTLSNFVVVIPSLVGIDLLDDHKTKFTDCSTLIENATVLCLPLSRRGTGTDYIETPLEFEEELKLKHGKLFLKAIIIYGARHYTTMLKHVSSNWYLENDMNPTNTEIGSFQEMLKYNDGSAKKHCEILVYSK